MINDISDIISKRRGVPVYDERKVEPILPSNPTHNNSQRDPSKYSNQDKSRDTPRRNYSPGLGTHIDYLA